MEITEKQLDDALDDLTRAIFNVAYAEMFLDELDRYFGEWNRLIEERKK